MIIRPVSYPVGFFILPVLNFAFDSWFAILAYKSILSMGRGDKKSRKGKQWKGSFGVSRNKNAIKARLKRSASQGSKPVAVVAAAAAEAAPKAKRAPKKKAEA